MDVRCERCKTEYEFDDARITEAGVTVKCTTCEHVFRVKKKALVVTVPVRPGEVDASQVGPPPLASSATPAPAAASATTDRREWRLRQASGNVLQFKELTTLQKWIVERRAVRDDAISLTGETWKRLGDIAELSPFFDVVDQAVRVKELETQLATREPLPAEDELPPQLVAPVVPASAAPLPPAAPPTQPAQSFVIEPQAAPVAVPKAARSTDRYAARSAARRNTEEELALAGIRTKGRGGAGKWLGALVLIGVLGAGGYLAYQHYWLPSQRRSEVDDPALAVTPPPATAATDLPLPTASAEPIEEAAPEPAPEPSTGSAVAVTPAAVETPVAAQPPVAEVVAAPPAPAPVALEVVPAAARAPAPAVVPAAAPAVAADPATLVRQGDRLRMRDRPKQALASYDRALELLPESTEAMAGRGLALHDLGRDAEAEAAFREALRVDPRYAVAVMGLAETYRHQGKRSEALEQYRRYLEILPNGPEAPVARTAIDRLKE